MQDLRQIRNYARYMTLLGWSVVRCRISGISCQVFIKKIPLLGNIAKLQRPSGKLDARILDAFAKKHRLAVLYIEPTNNQSLITNHNFIPAKSSFLPSKTIHINLLQSNKVLLSQMDKDTRYVIRLAQKRGITVKESKDISKACLPIEAFIKLWHQSARHRGMWLPQTKEIKALWDAFDTHASILLAYNSYMHVHSQSVLAGVLIVRTPTTAHYMYAASTKEGNHLCAPSLLVWEAIKLAKKQSCKIFDFEGIYDERYPQTKSWRGFTKFKEGFGGKIIIYPKTLVKHYHLLTKLLTL